MKKYAIGIDIGGTKISIVLGNNRGRILTRRVIPTRIKSQTKPCIKDLLNNIEETLKYRSLKKSQVAGIGIGIPGAVNTAKGIVPRSPHLKGWQGLALRRIISSRFKLPVAMANDANAAALAEIAFGAGKKAKHFVYMTVSTGVGGGLVLHGKLLEGARFVAGEIGHMAIVPEGNACNCGRRGCLEAYASGTAMTRYAVSELKKGRRSIISRIANQKGKKVSGEILGLAAKQRDRLALESYCVGGFFLGLGVANLLNILNPEVVSVGGGVLKSAPADFWKAMIQSCRRHAWPEAFKSVKIIRSRLGTDVGDLGALALAFDLRK